MKFKKGLIAAIASGGMAVALWAGLAGPTAQQAPLLPGAASQAIPEQALTDGEDIAGGSSTQQEDSSSTKSDGSTTDLAAGEDPPAETDVSSEEAVASDTTPTTDVVAGEVLSSDEDQAQSGGKKLKDPRDKYCPPAAGYGDKPKKGCIGDY